MDKKETNESLERRGAAAAQDAGAHGSAPCATTRQRIVLGALAACCVALIVVCGVALATDTGSAAPSSEALVQGSAAVSEAQQEAADASSAEDPAGAEGAETGDASSGGGSDASDTAASNDARASDSDRDTSSTSGTGGNGNKSSSTSTSGQSSASGNGTSKGPQPKTVNISVSIDSSAADGSVSGSGSFTFEVGATPYDALCALRGDVTASQSSMGIYVEGIGGLFENDSRYPGVSGWKYMVNGSVIMQSAGSYQLHDGDHVTWYYTTTG